MRHLNRPVALTRLGMIAEAAVRAFWPLWSVVFVAIAPLMFGWHEVAPLEVFWGYVVVSALAFLIALVWGIRRFRWPARVEAVDRVDATLRGRPIAAMADRQAIGSGDEASEAVWAAHQMRMAERTKDARTVQPNLKVSDRDPYGLRFMALLFFVAALLFGSLWRVGTVADVVGGEQVLATGPTWEGWVAPPAYTGKPTLYLNDIPAGALPVPAGSKITLRLYGEVGALTVAETISGRIGEVASASDAQQEFIATQSGDLSIDGDNGILWSVDIIADTAPTVELIGPIEADALGELSQPFRGEDDYGVMSGTATFALDLGAVDRRYGLAATPEAFDVLVLDLPMPFNDDRDDFEEVLMDDLSEHPLANLPVTLSLDVVDEAGQAGVSEPEALILPGRRFFQPFAKAIVEQRRDLLWTKDNGERVVQVMKAIANRPEGLFSNETAFLRMRQITRRLDRFVDAGLTDENRDEIVEAMWALAIQLEEGTLADARERLRRAQERLAEAMRNGANEAEIAELMNELREATDEYMQLLADQMDPNEDGTDQPDSGEQEGMEFTQSELDALMDRIEELMKEGRMAEAAELMEQLNELMENLRITQGEGGEGGPQTPGQRSMEDLAETLEEQEQLSDDAFRELQEQANRNDEQGQEGQDGQQDQQGQQGEQGQGQQGNQGQDPGSQQGQGEQGEGEGQQGSGQGVGDDNQGGQQDGGGEGGEGEGGSDAGSLSERQQALRDELGRQRGNLPSLGGEAGDIARQSLDRAEDAMEGAEDALREGDLAEAIDQQSEAMDALRNGMRAMNEALAQNRPQPGQGSEQGEATGGTEPARRDPLGRELGNSGQVGSDENMLNGEDVYRRAEELLDEIRRRSAEQERPELEKDYLRRLLDRF